MVALAAHGASKGKRVRHLATDSPVAPSRRHTHDTWCIVLAGMVGLFLPSSIGTVLQPRLTLLLCCVCTALFMMTMRRGQWLPANGALALFITALFAFFTATSPLSELAVGGYFPYLLFMAALMVDTRSFVIGPRVVVALVMANVIILSLGYGTVLNNDWLRGQSEAWYKAFDDDLFESMILWYSKPVSVFASHSISAFCYAGLCLLNQRLSRMPWLALPWRWACKASAVGYLVMMPLLVSNTALALFVPTALWLAWQWLDWLRADVRAFALSGAIATGAGATLAWLGMGIDDVRTLVVGITSDEGSGYLGRYVAGGRLQPTYDYLLAYPWQPIGVTMSPNLALGDNFIADYILRISVLGYAAVLCMLWFWLRRNVTSAPQRWVFMAFFLLADLGYPLLTYPRVAAALPMFILLWRCSERATKARRIAARHHRMAAPHERLAT
jgi:hypothetical protein